MSTVSPSGGPSDSPGPSPATFIPVASPEPSGAKLSPWQQFLAEMTPEESKIFWNSTVTMICNQITANQNQMTQEQEKEREAIDDPGALFDVD